MVCAALLKRLKTTGLDYFHSTTMSSLMAISGFDQFLLLNIFIDLSWYLIFRKLYKTYISNILGHDTFKLCAYILSEIGLNFIYNKYKNMKYLIQKAQ